MPSNVSIEISARDNASATLDSVRNKLQIFDQFGRSVSDLTQPLERTSSLLGAFDISASKASRAVRTLAVPIASELAPALGRLGGDMAGVIATSAALGSGLGALAIGATTLAAIVGTKLVKSWRDAADAAESWARAVEVGDIATLSKTVDTQAEKVRGLAKEYLALEAAELRARAAAAGGSDPESAFLAGGPGVRAAQGKRDLDKEQRELADQRLTLEAAQAAQSIALSFSDALTPYLKTSEQLTKIRETEAEALKKIRAEFAKFSDATLATGGFGFSFEEFDAARKATEGFGERELARDRAANAALLDLDQVPTSMGLSTGDVERGQAALAGLARDRIRLRSEELDVLRQTTALELEAVGLSRDQVRAIEEQAIARQHALELEIAGDDQAKQRLADLRAGTGMQRIAERDEALPGLLRGLADVEKEWSSVGLRMQAVARDMASGISTSLGDAMFGPLEERMKGLPPLFRGVLTSMLRAITDDLGRAITAQLFGGLKSLLPRGGTPGLTPFDGAGSGGGPPGVGGPVILNVAGRPLAQSELATAYAAAGDQGIQALRAGRATVVGDQFIPETYDLPGFSTGSVALSPTRTPGFFDRALPIAGSAAALGATAFGATGARTGFDVGASAALGGLTGAMLGQQVGNLFGSGTTGAAGGALAGAAINTTLAMLAKAEADKQAAKQRQAAEVARAAGAGSDLVSSAGQAQGPADLFRRLTAFGSGTTGGSANPAVITTLDTPEGPKMIGRENPVYPTATLSDLLRNPGSIQANIQAGVDPNALTGPNAATSTALQQMATDLVAQFREREQGIGVTEEDMVVPSGLRRRTTVPASRAAALGTGGDLEIDELALDALSDDDRAAVLLDVLGQVGQERDIVSTISDGATGKIVSITRVPRSTIVLPPATTPPPAPVTPPGSTPTTPPLGTAELLTAGGATAIGIAAMLADKNSILNAILPSGWTGPDLAAKISQLFSTGSLSGGAGTIALGDLEAAGRDLFTSIESGAGAAASGEFGFSEGLAVLNGLGSIYGLVQGAQSGDPVTIATSVLSLYSAISTLSGPLTGVAIPGLIDLVAAGVGVLTGAGAQAGTQIASTALAAAGPYLAAAGPLIQGLIQWAMIKDQQKDLKSWAVIGKVATALQSQAQTALTQANALFAALRAAGVTDPAAIKNALAMGSSALAAYYRKVDGPGGPIGISDFYAFTKQSPAPIQQAAAQLQQHMKDATARLIQGGATAAQLGQEIAAPAEWGELYGGQGYGATLQATPKTLPGQPGGQWVSQGEGTVWVEDGTTTPPQDVTQNVNQGIGLNASQGRFQAPDAVNTQFGGAFWTMWNFLLGSNERPDPGEAVGTPVITGAQPWLPGGAAPGAVSGPNAFENPLSVEELRMLLALAALAQGDPSGTGGSDQGSEAGPPGTVGTGSGNSGGLGEAA